MSEQPVAHRAADQIDFHSVANLGARRRGMV
jgi:hypothetical protein